MANDQLNAALQAEYFQLQKVVEDMDGRALTIKAWSISFSLVAIAGAFATKANTVFLVSALSALLFWWLEARWKTFQDAYYGRIDEIEKHFRNLHTLHNPLQIRASWYQYWKPGGIKRLLHIAFWPHVALPHAVVALLALVLFVFTDAGVLRV